MTDTDKIRELNDNLRRNLILGGFTNTVLTSGVSALSTHQQIDLMTLVQNFNDFNPGNDPYGEHDFGKITYKGQDYFFKIDYYDTSLQYHSPNPADPTQTRRILTIMRADEY